MKFRKKPVVIDAEQLTWANWSAVCSLCSAHPETGLPEGMQGVYVDPATGKVLDPDDTTWDTETPLSGLEIGMLIPTLEGTMLAREGDYVIKGVQGEIYPCKPDIFESTYEPVS